MSHRLLAQGAGAVIQWAILMVLWQTNGGAGKRKSFRWWWDGLTLHIERENGKHDRFQTAELGKIT